MPYLEVSRGNPNIIDKDGEPVVAWFFEYEIEELYGKALMSWFGIGLDEYSVVFHEPVQAVTILVAHFDRNFDQVTSSARWWQGQRTSKHHSMVRVRKGVAVQAVKYCFGRDMAVRFRPGVFANVDPRGVHGVILYGFPGVLSAR